VAVAVLHQLAAQGAVDTSAVADAIVRFGLDPEAAPSWEH
jgi:pyruvate dehydrogenase complex dehydrogenase (E1) component